MLGFMTLPNAIAAPSRLTRLLAAALALLAAMPLDAFAQRRPSGDTGSVSVCSRYGRGCVSGPTRSGKFDREVRLPGGTWIGCRLDCRNTLREETVDFFETLRERAPDRTR